MPHLNFVGSLDLQKNVTSPFVLFGSFDVKTSSGGVESEKHIDVMIQLQKSCGFESITHGERVPYLRLGGRFNVGQFTQ